MHQLAHCHCNMRQCMSLVCADLKVCLRKSRSLIFSRSRFGLHIQRNTYSVANCSIQILFTKETLLAAISVPLAHFFTLIQTMTAASFRITYKVCVRKKSILLTFSPAPTGLHIQTDTDWKTVVRPSEMFETVLANGYLVNDIKRLQE